MRSSVPQTRSPRPIDQTASWSAGVAVLALVTALSAASLSMIPGLLMGDANSLRRVAGEVTGMIVQNAIFIAIPVLLLMLIGGRRLTPQTFGFRRPNKLWTTALIVVVAFIGYLAVGAGLGSLLNIGGQQDTLPQKLGASGSLGAGIAIGLAVTILAPLGEEFLMRGVVYPGLRNGLQGRTNRGIGIAGAAGANGLIFGALHVGGTNLIFIPVLITFGITLSLLFELTGTLWAPIGLHLGNNTLAIATSLGWTVPGGLGLGVLATAVFLFASRAFVVWDRGTRSRALQ